MEQMGPFRFLRRLEFEKLTPAEKIVYLEGATSELRRRGEELRSFTQLVADWSSRVTYYQVKSPLSGNDK